MPRLLGLRTDKQPARSLRLALFMVGGLSALALASASGPVVTMKGASRNTDHAAKSPEFKYYLNAHSSQRLIDQYSGIDPVATTDLRGTPYNSRDVIVAYGFSLGRYRNQGPHLIAIQTPDLSDHLTELERDLPKVVPADYTGLVVIDYEPWWALWDRVVNIPSELPYDAQDKDYKDDWRDYIREYRPYLLTGLTTVKQEAVFQRTYEAYVRTFLMATYYKCKQIRPRAQFSFYNYPQFLLNNDELTPRGVRGYGDLSHKASRLNDKLAWYFDMVDFVTCRIYPVLKVHEQWPPAERRTGDISPAVHEDWLSSMVRESVRLAKGKPVYPMHSPVFYTPHYFKNEPVSQYQHEEVYRILAENGAAGVILWHAAGNQVELDFWRNLWNNELKPAGINSDRVLNGPSSGSSGS